MRELAIELNKKLTIPVSCLVFALIGMPLGIRAHRSVRSRGFTIGLLPGSHLLPVAPQRRGAGRNGKTLPDHRDLDAELHFRRRRNPSFFSVCKGSIPPAAVSALLPPILCRARPQRTALRRRREIIMKIVDRYLIKEYLRNLLFITLSFISLFLIIDFFEKFRMFLSNHATFPQMGSYFFFRIPMIVSQILPAAILLASLMTCGYLSRHSEITAMKANGISLYRIALPILTIAVLISLLIFFLNEWVTPYTNERAENIRLVEVQKRPSLGSFKQDQIWYRGQKGIYNFRLFDAQTNTLQGITIHYLDREMKLIMRLDAERGEWKEGRWLFHNLLITRFNDGEFPVLSKVQQQVVDLPETPVRFPDGSEGCRGDGLF